MTTIPFPASPGDIIDAFGGTGAVAAMLGLGSSAVSNWRRTGIPTRVHSKLLVEAKARDIELTAEMLLAQVGEAA